MEEQVSGREEIGKRTENRRLTLFIIRAMSKTYFWALDARLRFSGQFSCRPIPRVPKPIASGLPAYGYDWQSAIFLQFRGPRGCYEFREPTAFWNTPHGTKSLPRLLVGREAKQTGEEFTFQSQFATTHATSHEQLAKHTRALLPPVPRRLHRHELTALLTAHNEYKFSNPNTTCHECPRMSLTHQATLQ
jgi:hypothetical protein